MACTVGCQDYTFEELPASTIKEKRWVHTITIATAVDILFVVDNSGSMVGEQRQLAESFEAFSATLEENFGEDYYIAVVTTSMESGACPQSREAIAAWAANVLKPGPINRLRTRLIPWLRVAPFPSPIIATPASFSVKVIRCISRCSASCPEQPLVKLTKPPAKPTIII